MKIRLYKGPLDGKVFDGHYGESAVVTGPRKMTRKQLEDWKMKNDWQYLTPDFWMRPQRPMVKCVYRRVRVTTTDISNGSVMIHDTPCIHPDGSIFYVYERTIAQYPSAT